MRIPSGGTNTRTTRSSSRNCSGKCGGAGRSPRSSAVSSARNSGRRECPASRWRAGASISTAGSKGDAASDDISRYVVVRCLLESPEMTLICTLPIFTRRMRKAAEPESRMSVRGPLQPDNIPQTGRGKLTLPHPARGPLSRESSDFVRTNQQAFSLMRQLYQMFQNLHFMEKPCVTGEIRSCCAWAASAARQAA